MTFRIIATLFWLYIVTRHFLLQASEEYLVSAGFTCMLLFLLLRLCASFTPAIARLMKSKKISTNKAINNVQVNRSLYLTQEIARRTDELNTLRQTLAAEFHDETGNLLSVIIHQATLLRLKADKDLQPIVENILDSSQQLYTTSKHLLWNLHHDSDDPGALFEYIVNFGQTFCNKVDICFSAEKETACSELAGRLEPAAALNLIFIFKEAMNNVARHAGAKEMALKMAYRRDHLVFELSDDGRWKEPDPVLSHYGISGIERRCQRNGFTCRVSHNEQGTQVEITVPVIRSGLVETPAIVHCPQEGAIRTDKKVVNFPARKIGFCVDKNFMYTRHQKSSNVGEVRPRQT